MTSKVKNLKGLEKELSISFSLKDMDPTIESKLKELSKNLDLKGFRKGKVPMNVVKSKYYQQCYNWINCFHFTFLFLLYKHKSLLLIHLPN